MMLRKLLILSAFAGLLASAFAGPRAGLTKPPKGHDARRQYVDSIRKLHDRARSAALTPGIDVNRIIRQVRPDPEPRPMDVGDPIELCEEFMPAPDADDGDQHSPAVAFDGTNYLVVWVDWRDSPNSDIYGARVKADGVLLDPESFVVSLNTEDDPEYSPSVAFDGTNYLVVWEDERDGDGDIYGALVSTGGAVQNGVRISENAPGVYKHSPSVAIDETNYLVVWVDWRESWPCDIYGARVSPDDGAPVGTGDSAGLLISTNVGGDCEWFPSVAFDGTNYLVAWEDWRDDNIYGARVSPDDGAPVGTGDSAGLLISTNTGTSVQQYPSVAFDGTNYLVVWDDDRDGGSDKNIYGARVSPDDGAPVGTGDSTGILITPSTGTSNQLKPSVAFDGTDYLVAWEDYRSGSDIYGCQVSPGADVGTAYQVSTRTSLAPAVACGPEEYTVLVAYRSVTEAPYNTDRIWAIPGIMPMDGDVGTDSIERPVASFLMPSWQIPPKARVKNYGAALRTFRAKFTVTPGSYTSTKTVLALAADEEREVVFDPFTLSTGVFTAQCSTRLADDSVESNDSLTAIFQGCTFINFFDLTDGDLVADPPSGSWSRGVPASPWTRPPMDSFVWGDRTEGNYNNGENATLTSPTYEALQDYPAIAFQHSFATEADHDGGNFSYKSVGPTWDVLTPSAGQAYTGYVSALYDDGWSGSSSGWVQSVFTIPVTNTTPFRVRWNFASDGTGVDNGWILDEVAGIGCELAVGLGGASFIDTMNVWPNPVRGAGQISYTLRKDCNVSINLYDATGRLAARVPTSGFRKGRNTATLDATRLARGVYFVKVKGETDTKTTKVIIE